MVIDMNPKCKTITQAISLIEREYEVWIGKAVTLNLLRVVVSNYRGGPFMKKRPPVSPKLQRPLFLILQSIRLQLLQHFQNCRRRDRKADALRFSIHRRVHADDLALRIQQRAARVARVN